MRSADGSIGDPFLSVRRAPFSLLNSLSGRAVDDSSLLDSWYFEKADWVKMDPTHDPTELEMAGESDEEKKPEDKKGRRKIKIELIEDKSRRHITFSKRKLGIMKKVRVICIMKPRNVSGRARQNRTNTHRPLQPLVL